MTFTPDRTANLAQVPDAEPRVEPLRSGGPNKPYEALGRRYEPVLADLPMAETGLASWYGRKYHGRSTSSGEPYDMFAMTAAHPTLPLPCYVRVTNTQNNRSVIVHSTKSGSNKPPLASKQAANSIASSLPRKPAIRRSNCRCKSCVPQMNLTEAIP